MSAPAPRLPVVGPADDPRLSELFAKGLNGPDGTPLNIFGTLGNHPDLLRRWLVFAAHVLSKNTLTPRDRELLILRTGWNCRSRYEWGQHVLIARECGITDDEIERVAAGPDETGPGEFEWGDSWTELERLLLTAADELHRSQTLTDATWAGLGEHLSTEQVLDLVATVGNYHLVAMFLNATRVELDPGVPETDLWPQET